MPSGATIGARIVLSFGEEDVKRKEYRKEDADFTHGRRNVHPECLLPIVRM